MSVLDCGQPVEVAGTCPDCRLGDRPLWSDGAVVACATCLCRRHPGRDVSFLAGERATTARQPTLL